MTTHQCFKICSTGKFNFSLHLTPFFIHKSNKFSFIISQVAQYRIALIILTSIRKSIFTQYKCSLFLMINNCNLCRSTEIYLVHLSFQEFKKEEEASVRIHTYETPVHQNSLHTYMCQSWIRLHWYKLGGNMQTR